LPKQERILLWSTAAVTLVLRALLYFRYRFDADEQHHLHVIWGWTDGLVQYRDYFDNHAPLFHMSMAPLLWLLTAAAGERPDVLLWMRAPMLVLFAAVAWGTYALGRRLYDERIGLWAATLLALFPPFFLKSLELRTDNLWNALWIVALVGVLRGWRPFAIGLLLGCAFAVSLKTVLLIASTVVAAALVTFFVNGWRPKARAVAAGVIGFAIVPVALALFFAASGAWDALLYCNITFNGALARTRDNLWVGRAIFPFTAAGLLWLAWRFRRTEHPWRYFFAVTIGVYTVTLAGFWILISPRDFLPLMPLAAIFAAAAIASLREPLRVFGGAALLCVVALWYYADHFANRTAWHTTMMEQALRLTHPGEPLLDLKGETIYRRRPFYYAFESITRAQIAHGMIRDTVAADVIRTRTHVAQADGPMWPPQARAFLSENFLNVGRLRVSGQPLQDDGSFTIAVPGQYVIISELGEAHGTLDGSAYAIGRTLAPGPHRFQRAVAGEHLAVLWAPAFQRGHSPFHLRDTEF
jgi:hypothetical protein